jgi:hypothetical protein
VKNLVIVTLCLLPIVTLAETTEKVLKKSANFLNRPEVMTMSCAQNPEEEMTEPRIKAGEVKITYPCEAYKLESSAINTVTFFEPYDNQDLLDTSGLILRQRSGYSKDDVTLKYRPLKSENGTRPPLSVKTKNFEEIQAQRKIINAGNIKGDKSKLDMDCEADVSYVVPSIESTDNYDRVDSCSISTNQKSYVLDTFNNNYKTFAAMVTNPIIFETDLAKYNKFDIISTSLKIKGPKSNSDISVEKWEYANKDDPAKKGCVLEFSKKFERDSLVEMHDTIKGSMNGLIEDLKVLLPESSPSKKQGNKTKTALDFIKAK